MMLTGVVCYKLTLLNDEGEGGIQGIKGYSISLTSSYCRDNAIAS
jgi:hypothetical protein